MVVKNLNGRSHQILENGFMTCGASKCLGMHAQAITHPLLPFSSPILLHVGFLHAAEVSCVLSFTFLLISLIFACLEIRFGIVQYMGKEDLCFYCIFMDSSMAENRFYLAEWPRSKKYVFGFHNSHFGLPYCHRRLQKSKT